MRLVSETDMGEGEYKYEWIDHVRHHHLICRSCDQVNLLDHKFLEILGTEILDDYGFESDLDHVALFGVCKDCRETPKDAQT
jgi:Fur family ferric uptake transcriptional regulator